MAQNPHPLTPRLQFLIPVGCQPTPSNKPKPPTFDTKTSVSTGFQHKAPNKPHVAQNPHPLTSRLQFLQVANIKHQTSSTCPKPPPFDTETSFFNPSRLPTYSTRQAPRGPNPHHLTPRLQFLILVGSQPTAPDKPHVAQTPPFDTKTSVSNPCRLPTYSTRQTTRSPNPYPLTPRLQFLIPVGCQPTAPDKPLQHQTNPT